MLRIAPFVLAVCLPCAALGGSITFEDGTFDAADWEIQTFTKGAGGVTSATQRPSGGNPGQYREITTALFGGSNPVEIFGFHRLIGASYDPGTLGSISSIDYDEDAILISGFGAGQATGPAIRQAGVVFFYRETPRIGTPDPFWVHITRTGLLASDFIGYPDTTLHPDFSASGSPISVGFWRANSGGAYTIVAGIDNWTITIHGTDLPDEVIPEPASALLLLVGFGVLVALRRRLAT